MYLLAVNPKYIVFLFILSDQEYCERLYFSDIPDGDGLTMSSAGRTSESQSGMLRKLLQAPDDDEYLSYSSTYAVTQQQSKLVNSTSPLTSQTDTTTLSISPSSTSSTNKAPENHHLLKVIKSRYY